MEFEQFCWKGWALGPSYRILVAIQITISIPMIE